MTLPSSGYLGLKQIVAEFGGSGNHGLSEYYNAASGIPVSGRLGLRNFYGKSVGTKIVYTQADWNNGVGRNYGSGVHLAQIFGSNLEQGLFIFENHASILPPYGAGMFTYWNSFPAGSRVIIVNKGIISGKAGNGGGINSNGLPGSPGIDTTFPIEIDNTDGIICSAGGGGAGYHVGKYIPGTSGKYGGGTSAQTIVSGGGGGGGGHYIASQRGTGATAGDVLNDGGTRYNYAGSGGSYYGGIGGKFKHPYWPLNAGGAGGRRGDDGSAGLKGGDGKYYLYNQDYTATHSNFPRYGGAGAPPVKGSSITWINTGTLK